jgi:uncharacterized membrane protein YbhN (UPF0104 family)
MPQIKLCYSKGMKSRIRLLAIILLVPLTIGVFVYYIVTHPALRQQLIDLNPLLLATLLGLYGLTALALMGVLSAQLLLYNKSLGLRENFLLNSYTSLVNFFGPGQTGPGLRAMYLKQKHGVAIKQFTFATLLYYAFFAAISAVYLCIGSRPWWQTLLLVMVVGIVSYILIRMYARRNNQKSTGHLRGLAIPLLAATALQLLVQLVIYYLELRSLMPEVSIAQAATYTGAANFALFVSITPGAIGIRESFLALSQQLHHIPTDTIIAASVIDRAVYLVFLGLLFLGTLGMHAKQRLRIGTTVPVASDRAPLQSDEQ